MEMEAMDISEAVAHLTPVEREQFKDLIAECVARENDIRANRDRADRALTQMVDTIERLYHEIAGLTDRVGILYLKVVEHSGPVH
jgi:hypothetical protein